jgi:hypothetical protein
MQGSQFVVDLTRVTRQRAAVLVEVRPGAAGTSSRAARAAQLRRALGILGLLRSRLLLRWALRLRAGAARGACCGGRCC